MIGFFNEQRNRVLREMTKFVDAHNAKRLGKIDKRELAMERIWSAEREDSLLRELYTARALGVSKRTADEIAAIFDASPIDERAIVNEIAKKITAVNETTRTRIAQQIAVGISRSYSTAQIANGVPEENYLGVAGVFDSATETRANLIAVTEVNRIYNLSALSSFSNQGVGRVEVLDGTMDEGCRQARGEIWTIEYARANPQEHPRCIRSFSPIFDGVVVRSHRIEVTGKPWHVARSGQCPSSKPWAVIKDEDGSIVACHETEADAQDHVAALYANE